MGRGGMYLATKKEINHFLERLKLSDSFVIVNTQKNRVTRYKLGITVQDQKDLICDLTDSDYISGPEDDYDSSRPGQIWKFKRSAFKTVFYIKIKIEDNATEAKALSCHIDNIEAN